MVLIQKKQITEAEVFIPNVSVEEVFKVAATPINWEDFHPQTHMVLGRGLFTPLRLGKTFSEIVQPLHWLDSWRQIWDWHVDHSKYRIMAGSLLFSGSSGNLRGSIQYTLNSIPGGVTLKRGFLLESDSFLKGFGIAALEGVNKRSGEKYLEAIKNYFGEDK